MGDIEAMLRDTAITTMPKPQKLSTEVTSRVRRQIAHSVRKHVTSTAALIARRLQTDIDSPEMIQIARTLAGGSSANNASTCDLRLSSTARRLIVPLSEISFASAVGGVSSRVTRLILADPPR